MPPIVRVLVVSLWFAWGTFLAVTAELARAQDENAGTFLFDSYEGSFVSAKKSILTINTLDGAKSFQILQTKEDVEKLDLGRPTSISVTGVEHTSFLKPGMTVLLEVAVDKNRSVVQPAETLNVLSLSEKLDTDAEPISDFDPDSGAADFRITGRIQSIDAKTNRIGILVQSGRKSIRYEIPVDPEKTRVEFDLPELSLAKPGSATFVRCLPLQATRNIASEVRVECPSVFPGDGAAANEVAQSHTAPEAADQDPSKGNENPEDGVADGNSGGGDGDDDAGNSAETEPGDAMDETPDESGEEADSRQVIEFDFRPPIAQDPAIDLSLLNMLLGIRVIEPPADESDGSEPPQTQESRFRPPAILRGRGWYKIN